MGGTKGVKGVSLEPGDKKQYGMPSSKDVAPNEMEAMEEPVYFPFEAPVRR